ncbi:efflux RND transporter periplasmic adaptor subunit [Skermanella mucosa]|uniref:efflux RND transporter periplasmic adaptor subunit n=1 Tax=Skermanella mucosa TaxID=1789672 RepID=UPI00192C15F1|nr:efflux RND transporter periplasmic adaptor subunit [Skermanella mucosa]UEM22665.1 efflux RND transporter periplasmic adaptor subunit [Skermanella mucosa]
MGRAVVVWIAVGAAVLAGAVGGYAALDEDRHDIPDVELATVDRGTIVRTISATGTLNAVGLVQVGSAVSGRIQSLNADFNSTVVRDQTVAQIDPAGFAAEVAEATAERDVAASGIAAATAKLARARAEAENARATEQVLKAKVLSARSVADQAGRDRQRAFASGRADFVAVAERERAASALDQARAALAAAEAEELAQATVIQGADASVGEAEAEVLVARATLAQREAALAQARVDLDRTTIRSPIDGVVIERNVDVGQTVAASLEAPVLYTIARDLRRLQVETFVDEADIGAVQPGQSVGFTVSAFPGQRFEGEVSQVRKAPQVIQNVVTYVVIITASNDALQLYPGMTATVDIRVTEQRDALRVPSAALRFRPAPAEPTPRQAPATEPRVPKPANRGEVYVLDKAGTFTAVPVSTGIADLGFTQITGGDLSEGQQVVVGRRAGAGT